MKILSLFTGIGAFEKALKNIGIDYELVGFSEIDKYATKSYCAVHGVDESLNLGDITKIEKEKLPRFIDLITHGSPCQDFSIAGKQEGGDKGTETRSSLMWNTVDIVEWCLPKYVVWENVKNLLSKKHKHNFDSYIEIMDKLGYNSYYQVLNAKDYGIPQNRERVYTISIRKDIDKGPFIFPEKQELKLRLKDMLEDEVDEKYYLSKSSVKNLQRSFGSKAKEVEPDGICDTLQAAMGCGGGNVPVLNVIGKLDIKGHDCVKRVYSPEGISPTLTNMQGGNRQPKIVEEKVIKKCFRCGSELLESDLQDYDYLCPNCDENFYEFEVKDEPIIVGLTQKHATISKDGIVPTLTSAMGLGGGHVPMHNYDYRARKLTPKECWRLMGFSDEDFEKAANVPTSNTQLYKQAGNSIVVNVLEKIFKNLFLGRE